MRVGGRRRKRKGGDGDGGKEWVVGCQWQWRREEGGGEGARDVPRKEISSIHLFLL